MIRSDQNPKRDRQNIQVIRIGLLVTTLFLVGGTLLIGGATAQQNVEITLDSPNSHTSSVGEFESQVPGVQLSTAITYNNGSNYEFVITDTDTGGTITTIPPIQATTSDTVVLSSTAKPGYKTERNFWPLGTTSGPVDAWIETNGSVTVPGVANLSVSLVNVTSGAVIDDTQSKSFVLGYVADYSQNSTTGSVEIGMNQSVLPDQTSINATIYNASVTFPKDTTDSTRIPLKLNAAENEFVGTVDSAELQGGNYSIKIDGTLPPQYGTTIEKYGPDKFTIDSTGSGSENSSSPDSSSGGSSGPVQLQTINAPQTISPGETYSVTYEVTNSGQGATAYTVTATTNRSNVTVVDFTGDIRSRTPTADPPSASTESVDVGQTGQFTVEYEVAANTTGSVRETITATAPLSGNSDQISETLLITDQSTPTNPTQRVLQITGKQRAGQLVQSDVTTLITIKGRGSSRNNILVKQNDVSAAITLFNRNN